MRTVLHWFRRDLRLADNVGLTEAVSRAENVIPVFILEDALRTGPDVGAARLGFLLKAVASLRDDLAARGYALVVRRGRSEVEIPKLCQETGAQAVFCNRRSEPYAQDRDERVRAALGSMGVAFESFKDAVVCEGRELLTQADRPYTVFTPYSVAWKKRNVPDPVPELPARAPAGGVSSFRSEPTPADPAEFGHTLGHDLPPAGESSARAVLDGFLNRAVFSYASSRDFPALDGTSHLSAHLRAGTIGIRTVLARLAAARAKAPAAEGQRSCDVFLNELIWREFYVQILVNFPHVMKGSFRPVFDRLPWSDDKDRFQAWSEGCTGYPIVDAAMRCLNATGWMHNRLRMISAMFLVKDLLISWQWGERYFMQKLIDGDLAANNGGWQWSAGTGTDAAPYFRIFNPVTQGEKFDPKGEFVRRWVPELAWCADREIHQPWKAGEDRMFGQYPPPMVRHEEARAKCISFYERLQIKGPASE